MSNKVIIIGSGGEGNNDITRRLAEMNAELHGKDIVIVTPEQAKELDINSINNMENITPKLPSFTDDRILTAPPKSGRENRRERRKKKRSKKM